MNSQPYRSAYPSASFSVREPYCDQCPAVAQDVPVKQVSSSLSGCPQCLSLQDAFKIRTPFDKQQISLYSNLRETYNTNLLALKMPR